MKTALVTTSALVVLTCLTGCGKDSAPTDAENPQGSKTCDSSMTLVDKESGTETALTDFGAVSLSGGAAFTVYAADFTLDMAKVSLFTKPQVPLDGNLVTVALTIFNASSTPEPIKAGTVIEAGTQSDELVFVVTHEAGETLHGNNTGATGQTTVRAVGENLCIDVEYSDDEKAVSGTIGTEVKALS